MRIIAALMVAIALLSGCSSEPPLESGYITSRTYDKQHLEQTSSTSYCAAYDKNGFCSNTITIPGTWYTVPDRWFFDLKSDDGKRTDRIPVTL